MEHDDAAFLLRVGTQQLHIHGPAKNMRCGESLFAHVDAELGAEVGDGGGGSPDGKVGTRNEERGTGGRQFFILSSSLFVFLQLRRQLAERQEAATGGFDLICYRSLQ
jgi:hypothetical protein